MATENALLFQRPYASSINKASIALPKTLNQLHDILFLCNPAFTEAAYVGCHYDSFQTAVRRLSREEEHLGRCKLEHHKIFGDLNTMELDVDPSLQRTGSHHSTSSRKSSRSQTVRVKPRKYSSYISSSASSISDKSLTSFPSFSPGSPKDERIFQLRMEDGAAQSSRKPSGPSSSIVQSLTISSPSAKTRSALFDDAPLATSHVPGAIHLANDEHIERLIARNGAVALVRQIAEDLAQRDTQIASLRRKGEQRERALRKIILECGLSNLDLETRLRAVEDEQQPASESSRAPTKDNVLVDMMTDAMSDTAILGDMGTTESDATVRARDALRAIQSNKPGNGPRGWRDYIWGTGTSRKSSRASSINEEGVYGVRGPASITRNENGTGRQTILENGIFQPPETTKPASRPSSIHSGTVAYLPRDRKSSSGLATLALKLVAGTTTARDADGTNGRGRASSTGTTPPGRGQSTASAKTTMSDRTALPKLAAKAIPAARRAHASTASGAALRGQQQERWDTMGASPENTRPAGADNSGPVEMDTILPPDAQPPTVTATYNNQHNHEFLTDRFGFIYDQRRKKRQREAAEKMQKSKRGSRVEMLSSNRSGLSPDATEDITSDERPETPASIEEDDKPAKRWQDYLKIATFPTELLSHTPSSGIPAFEVMEGGEVPRSPGITTEERGFLPSSSTTAVPPAISVISDHAVISKPDTAPPPTPTALSHEDAEPVKLLLKQLGDVHDSLQKEKTVRWNDFLRKVRAERKREGEAAAAVALADTRSQKAMTVMPEASLIDGEMIGVAGLGNKGKIGRAKWAEFKMLLLGGIPVAYRAKIWAECSGATALRIPGYYEDLAHMDGNDDPSIVAQIQMDINRTLTDNIFFRKGPGVAKLNEVLLAYSRRNAEVGYCQGMNLITACLLLIMPTAEDAFWVLTSIIENILPRGYYDHSLLASRADQQVLRQYVTEILPKLSSHFDDLSIELETLTFQWFLSVFTDCLSAEALFRVWDVVLCTNDGSTFLFQIALALLKLNETQLLHCETPASVYTYINHQMTNHAISIDGLIHASEGLRKVVKRDEVETRRAQAIEAEKDLIRQREECNAQRRAERNAAVNGSSSEPQTTETSTVTSLTREVGQLELGSNGSAELTVRAPLLVEEDVEINSDQG